MKTEAQFQLDFVPDTKAVTADDGTLYIEGTAADFGVDRQNEAFEEGAFDEGMKSYMERNPVLLYHHKGDKALGTVKAWERRGDGIWVKAAIEKPAVGSWAEDVYNKVKSGVIKSFSVGGLFRRRPGADGVTRIHKADIAEISVTPLPVNPRTQFGLSPLAAAAGKAFGELPEMDLEAAEKALTELEDAFRQLDEALTPAE